MTNVEIAFISIIAALITLSGTVIKLWAKDIKCQRAAEASRVKLEAAERKRIEGIIIGNTQVMTELKGMVHTLLIKTD